MSQNEFNYFINESLHIVSGAGLITGTLLLIGMLIQKIKAWVKDKFRR